VNKQEVKEGYRHERGLKIKPKDVTVCGSIHMHTLHASLIISQLLDCG